MLSGLPANSRRLLQAALLAVFVGALDLTVIAAILPTMVQDLQINTADIDRYVWIVNGYLIAYIIVIPVTGRISDFTGRPAAFAASLLIFVGGSIWCVLANDLTSVVIGRIIQGAGGGALLPISMALVGDLLPRGQRAGMLGLTGAVDTLGWVLGPIWGAAIVTIAATSRAWHWVFLINVPLALIAIWAIRQGGGTRSKIPFREWIAKIDIPGVLLLVVVLLGINLGLSAGGEIGGLQGGGRALGGTHNPLAEYSFALILVAVLATAVFIWWEGRANFPLMPLSLFKQPRFGAAILANFLTGAALIVVMVDVPVVVALLVGQDQISSTTALMMIPFTALMALLSLGGGVMARGRGERWVAATGVMCAAAGFAVLWFGLRDGDLLGLIPGLLLAGAGFGLVIAPIGAAAINAAPASERGIAAALTLVFRLLGMTIGISALTATGVSRLQTLTSTVDAVLQLPGESTAEFFARQTEVLMGTIIPLTLQVIRETFLIAGLIALVALIPIARLSAATGDTVQDAG